jgi:hypothetical protein
MADQGDFRAAASLMQQSAVELENVAKKCDNDDELLGEASVCEEISSDISTNEGMTKYQRKRVVNQAYTQTNQQGYVSEEKKDKDEKKEQK